MALPVVCWSKAAFASSDAAIHNIVSMPRRENISSYRLSATRDLRPLLAIEPVRTQSPVDYIRAQEYPEAGLERREGRFIVEWGR